MKQDFGTQSGLPSTVSGRRSLGQPKSVVVDDVVDEVVEVVEDVVDEVVDEVVGAGIVVVVAGTLVAGGCVVDVVSRAGSSGG